MHPKFSLFEQVSLVSKLSASNISHLGQGWAQQALLALVTHNINHKAYWKPVENIFPIQKRHHLQTVGAEFQGPDLTLTAPWLISHHLFEEPLNI
jgi:hypothetical protein